MRISDWSSDVCSSDLSKGTISTPFAISARARLDGADDQVLLSRGSPIGDVRRMRINCPLFPMAMTRLRCGHWPERSGQMSAASGEAPYPCDVVPARRLRPRLSCRSEEHTSELTSLMR